MTGFALLVLGVLVGSCATITDAAGGNELPDEKSAKTDRYMPMLCSPIPAPPSPSSSVHALRPADISTVYTLGMPPSQRVEASRVVRRLTELLSMFNPEVMNSDPPVDQASLQPRNLIKEAEELSLSLSHQVTDWKLVLLFIPADLKCACSPHVAADVKAAVQEVEASLQILQKRLHRTLVHAMVWSGEYQLDKSCECQKFVNQALHKATLLKALQDSLSHVLHEPEWHSSGEDFAVVLQSTPVILDLGSDSEDALSDLNRLAVQLWTDLLQPSTEKSKVADHSAITIPCPTQERPFLRTHINSPAEREGEFYSQTSARADSLMGTVMPCLDRSPSPVTPTSVHEVRPGDIKVVAAVGDSLTAANGVGAKGNGSLLLVMNQYRGLSWSIGGDENITTVTTLPNILRQFNPSLTGFSRGIGNENSPGAFLNQAVAGAKSGDMERQVRILVNKMKTDPRINFQNDWKVITLFIGGNDICDFCTDSVFFSPRNVASRIRKALDILHSEVPRAIVNLVELLNIIPLRELHNDETLKCPTWFVSMICPCVLRPREGSSELEKVKVFNRDYQLAMRELVDSGVYNTPNFTVVLQPFFREVFLPKLENGQPDRSYFSPDCFHLSQKAHTLMARALWNNMLEPVGNKTFTQDFTLGIDLKCPSETAPFFRTAENSNYTFPGPRPTLPPVTNWGSDFSCTYTAPSIPVPTSVHRLRPADIKVVAALGDSITASFGAKATSLAQLATEFRGVSWSIGGDETLETVTTLPNILRKFNPKIVGMSKGEGKNLTGFNMAVSGAKVAGIPEQVQRLIEAMKNDCMVDFESDWKLVTLFIGGNDLCQYCNDRAALSPQNYTRHLMESLDIMYKELPRTIVNVLGIMEIEGLRRIKRDSLGCTLLQENVCPCFLLPGEDSLELAEIKRVNREIQIETEALMHGGRYDGREDFAVVVQPFFKNTVVPLNAEAQPDTTYFSEDCFHFSERGHADMAVALWNNMLEPVGKKQTYNNFTNSRNSIKCPTEEHPYIFTKVNSVPSGTASTPPTAHTTQLPLTSDCSDRVAAWLTGVMVGVAFVVGLVVSWLVLSCRAKCKRKRKAKKAKKAAQGETNF